MCSSCDNLYTIDEYMQYGNSLDLISDNNPYIFLYYNFSYGTCEGDCWNYFKLIKCDEVKFKLLIENSSLDYLNKLFNWNFNSNDIYMNNYKKLF